MRVIISGASGLIGSALVASLRSDGHQVVALVRRPAGTGEIQWDPAKGVLAADALEGADAVVHLAGAGIGDHRWTTEYKRELVDSRVRSTTLLAETIAACSKRPPVLLSGSAIGIYGPSDGRDLDESSPTGTDFLADLCVQWEAATEPAAAAGTRVAHLRTGIVLTPQGGALKKMLPLFKLFAGGRFGSGKQWQSWISLPDEVGAIRHLLTANVSGPVNLTAPNPVTNAEFAKVLGTVLHRPALLPVPRFGPALLLGGELADSLLYTGQKVLPVKLQAAGFTFQHTTLDAAMRAVLAG
ncbi:MAG: TIGR01777 family oxidoreductase [Actinomycetota bacterium]